MGSDVALPLYILWTLQLRVPRNWPGKKKSPRAAGLLDVCRVSIRLGIEHPADQITNLQLLGIGQRPGFDLYSEAVDIFGDGTCLFLPSEKLVDAALPGRLRGRLPCD